jgi:energy-coupling factor transporter ATP-binding protein EcfA2
MSAARCWPSGERRSGSWQAEAMRVYLITGNPGSGKSTLAAELSRRGLIAVDADDLAFWEDNAGERADQPPGADDAWRRAHRWVWSRARIEQVIAAAGDAGRVFFCGIARNQDQMLDLFEKVFLLVIDAGTQIARLAGPAHATSPVRTEAMKRQIREGRHVFQAQMLARGAIPLDATSSPQVLADSLLACLGPV